MTVSTPSASELSDKQEIAAHLSWIRSYATVMTADNWADMALYIRRQVGELEYAAASQAKRIEELEGDCARKDELLTAAVADYTDAKTLADRLKLEAQMHAGEARTANSTIYEIYQVLSGGKGEPGNWHGATPAIEYIAGVKALLSEAEKVLEQYAALVPAFRSKPVGAADSAARREQEAHTQVEDAARSLLTKIHEATK